MRPATGWPGTGKNNMDAYFEDETGARLYLADMTTTQITYLLRAGHVVRDDLGEDQGEPEE
jgi:hypothetical protein